MKKLYIMLLAILCCVVSAYAFEIDGISYRVTQQPNGESPGEVEVTGGEIRSVIEIPENVSYNGITYTVTSIGNSAFSGRYNSGNCTKKYIIPGTVKTIGNSAFYDNYYLEEVEFNEGLQTIGNDAFGFNFQLKEIRIPSTVTSIENRAFRTNQQNLATISCLAETPPANLGSETFQGRTSATLHVTTSNVDAYREAKYWNIFSEIIGDIISMDDDNIPFADANVKAICVSNWDTNEDGELSLGEATAVSNLGEVFKNNNSITTFKELQYFIGLSIIDDHAFNGCSSLTSVTIPSSVTSIGVHAFDGCSSLTSITIPEGVTSIADYAYNGCSSLPSITIPESVTVIGENAFNSCSELTAVEVKNPTPVAITQNTFSNRANAILYVPKGSRSAYEAATYWNEFMEIVSMYDVISFADANVKAICVSKWDTNGDGELSYAEAAAITLLGEVFRKNTSITSFNELQYFKGLTTIGDYAFQYCTSLSSIAIPNSVTSIGDYAFQACASLTSITIPESVTSIGNYAFHNCISLTSITIGNGVTSIGYYAFQNTSLTSVTIPESVTSIGNFAFQNCTSLTSISIPESVTSIVGVFQNCTSLTSISIPNSVTSIGSRVFEGCTSLLSITIPNSVTSIGSYAFRGCSSLTSIIIPNSVTNLGEFAFEGCSGLTSVSIGSGVTSLKGGTFYECSNLESIQIPNGITSIEDASKEHWVNNSGRSGNWGVFSGCSGLTSITIPNSVTSIGSYAFQNCTSLTSIIIPENVTSIGDYAFNGCSGLTSVETGNPTPVAITRNTFSNRTNATLIVPSGRKSAYLDADYWQEFKDVVAMDDTISFADANVKAISVSKWDTNGDGELSYAEAAAVTSIGEVFRDNTSIESFNELQYFKGISNIDDYAFSGCSCLTSVTIPKSVTSIGKSAFSGCTGLTFISISNSVTSIGGSAFSGCSSMTSVTIPESVTAIGEDAFNGCSRLSYVEVKNPTPVEITQNTFSNRTNAILYVSNGSESAYKTITYWSDFKEIVEIDGIIPFASAYMKSTCVSKWDTNGDGKLSYAEAAAVTSLGGVFKQKTSVNSFDELKYFKGLTSIGYNEFYLCHNLSSITIPKNVTSIGNHAFDGCSKLTSITIPNSVTAIGERAFQGCSSLGMVISEISTPFAVYEYTFNNYDATLVVPKGSRADYKNVSGWNFAFIYEEGETIYDYDKEKTDEQGVKYILKQAEEEDDYSIYYSVTGHSDELNREIIIPVGLDGCPVKGIEANAFNGCASLLDITIPNTVTFIGKDAFANCSGLTSLYISDLEAWCKIAFGANPFPAHNLFLNGEEMTDLAIPSSVTSINDYAFYNCSGLTSVIIPNSVTTIGISAFQYCHDLATAKIGNDVSRIGDGVFANCENLSSVKLGSKVISIGANAFNGCASLTSIKLPNLLENIGAGAFQHTSLTTVYIPENVKSIDNSAFEGCGSLVSVSFGGGKTSIGALAFDGCGNLASVNLEDGIISIGYGAFASCAFSSIIIPNSVTKIGASAFQNCGELTSVIIGSGVTSLESATFQGCSSLTTITIPNSVTSIADGYNKRIKLNNGKYYYSRSGVFYGCSSLTSVTIGNGVTHVGSYAFLDCSNLFSVKMGENVNSIGDGAFSNCSNLTSIILPNMLDSIGENVFPGSMISIEFPNSFTDIPDSLFFNNNFQYIKLGNNVKSIGKNAFGSSNPVIEISTSSPPTIASNAFPNVSYMSNINVIVPDAKAETAYRKATVWKEMTFSNQNNIAEVTVDTPGDLSWELVDECNMMPAKVVGLKVNGTINDDDFNQMLVNMKSLLRLDLSDCNITEIPAGALSGKTQLQELILPTKLQTIGQNAFQNCIGLQKLTSHAELQSIGQSAFQNCISLQEVNLQAQTIEQSAFQGCAGLLEINLQTQTVGQNAFQGCISLQKLTVQDGLQTIQQSAFQGCTILRELNLQAQTIGQNAFKSCSSLQKLNLQAGLQTIDRSAFEGCASLIGLLDLPSTLISIGESAFVGTNFSSVKLSSALVTIGDNAFHKVPITQLTLPKKVASIGASAFAGTKITGLVINGVPSIGADAFADTPIEGHVTIPDGVTYLGAGAFRNSQLSTVFLPNSIKTLSQEVFQDCPNLDLVYVPDNYTNLESSVFDGCGSLKVVRLSANLTSMGEYTFQNTPLEYLKVPSQVEVLPMGVLKNCKNLESLSLPSSLKTVEGEALIGCTALRNLSVEALDPPVIRDMSAINGINTDLCLISIPTQSYRKYVLAEYWGQFVQMRNDISVETEGNGEIAFESVNDEEEEEEEYETREYGPRRARRRAPQLASEDETMAIANNGSSIYVPQQGQVRFYILPAEGEKLLSATLDGVDIMPYIVDGVYTATADKRKAKLVVKFSGSGGSAVKSGDVNGDGDVDIADAVMIVNRVVGKPTPSFVAEAADVNNDGDIDIADAVRIVNLVVGKIPSLTRQYNYFLPDPQ